MACKNKKKIKKEYSTYLRANNKITSLDRDPTLIVGDPPAWGGFQRSACLGTGAHGNVTACGSAATKGGIMGEAAGSLPAKSSLQLERDVLPQSVWKHRGLSTTVATVRAPLSSHQ